MQSQLANQLYNLGNDDTISPNKTTKTLFELGITELNTMDDIKNTINFNIKDDKVYVNMDNVELYFNKNNLYKNPTIDNLMDIYTSNKEELDKLSNKISIPLLSLSELKNKDTLAVNIFEKDIGFSDLIKLNMLATIIIAIKEILNGN